MGTQDPTPSERPTSGQGMGKHHRDIPKCPKGEAGPKTRSLDTGGLVRPEIEDHPGAKP